MRFLLLLCAVFLGFTAPAQAQKRIALTFDDTPRGVGAFFTKQERARRLIAQLNKAGVDQAAFFVNPGNVKDDADAAIVDGYVQADHVIANHGFSHLHLNATTTADYLADIDLAQRWLTTRQGYRPWFRYPFLDEGEQDRAKRDAVRAGLRQRGLQNGYVTAEGADWNMEQLTIDARKAGKEIDREALRALYVDMHVQSAEFSDTLMREVIGRSPAHVMLLHETDLAALYLVDLVTALRANGWQIVTADTAYADPLALEALRYETPSAFGTLTEMLAWQKGLPTSRWSERNTFQISSSLFAQRVLHENKHD